MTSRHNQQCTPLNDPFTDLVASLADQAANADRGELIWDFIGKMRKPAYDPTVPGVLYDLLFVEL